LTDQHSFIIKLSSEFVAKSSKRSRHILSTSLHYRVKQHTFLSNTGKRTKFSPSETLYSHA